MCNAKEGLAQFFKPGSQYPTARPAPQESDFAPRVVPLNHVLGNGWVALNVAYHDDSNAAHIRFHHPMTNHKSVAGYDREAGMIIDTAVSPLASPTYFNREYLEALAGQKITSDQLNRASAPPAIK